MSLLPRLFARRTTPSPATLFTHPSLLSLPSSSSSSCSRRSYSDEAPPPGKKSPWIQRMDILPVDSKFPHSQWKVISDDILSQLPQKVLGEYIPREVPEPKGELSFPSRSLSLAPQLLSPSLCLTRTAFSDTVPRSLQVFIFCNPMY